MYIHFSFICNYNNNADVFEMNTFRNTLILQLPGHSCIGAIAKPFHNIQHMKIYSI